MGVILFEIPIEEETIPSLRCWTLECDYKHEGDNGQEVYT